MRFDSRNKCKRSAYRASPSVCVDGGEDYGIVGITTSEVWKGVLPPLVRCIVKSAFNRADEIENYGALNKIRPVAKAVVRFDSLNKYKRSAYRASK